MPTFTYLVTQIVQRHPDLAYLHVVEPGLAGDENIDKKAGEVRFISLPTYRYASSSSTTHAVQRLLARNLGPACVHLCRPLHTRDCDEACG